MEPGLPGERDKSSPSVVVHDSESGSEVPAAASEASSIDNAALMKQLQERIAKLFIYPWSLEDGILDFLSDVCVFAVISLKSFSEMRVLIQEAQKAIADATRAAEDAKKTAEAVKRELAREKQKVEQLEKEKGKTTTAAAQAADKSLSSPPPQPPPLPPPAGMVTRKRKKSMRESGGEDEG